MQRLQIFQFLCHVISQYSLLQDTATCHMPIPTTFPFQKVSKAVQAFAKLQVLEMIS